MSIWKGICTCVGCALAVGVCVASAGAATPFIAASAAPWLISGAGIAGFFVGDKADKESVEKEKLLMQDQRYKDGNQAMDNQEKQNIQAKSIVDEIVGKLNGSIPRKPYETDEFLNQQLVIAQNNLKKGEDRLNRLRKDVDKLRKELGGSQSLMSLLGLDKLSLADKVMIAGGIILIIYLLKK